MEIKEKVSRKEYKSGNVINHTDLPGERNPLPKLPENLRWRGHERRKDTGAFISYIVEDKNAELPTIDELSPEDEPVFKTREEALAYGTEEKRKKMEEAWEKATSKDGRPPIGGAQDN